MMGEERPSGIVWMVHFKCDFVTFSMPVGSTAKPGPPRPLSQYTTPPSNTGETVSPFASHHHSNLPLLGSTPWMAFDADTNSWGLPLTVASTGVLCAKPSFGRGSSHLTAPVFLS